MIAKKKLEEGKEVFKKLLLEFVERCNKQKNKEKVSIKEVAEDIF